MTESNGAVRTFTQPYSAVPYMLREGRGKFSLSVGRYHSGGVGALAGISAGHFVLRFDGGIHPLWWYAAGPGLSGVGAGHGPRFWRVRIAGRGCHQAVTRTPSGKRYTGHSLRAQYQKNFVSSGTAFSLASYRYSSSGYYDFAEASALESARASRQPASPGRAVGVAKPWWPGSLAVSAWSQEYWHRQSRDETVHLGFYSARKGISGAWAITTPAPAASKK